MHVIVNKSFTVFFLLLITTLHLQSQGIDSSNIDKIRLEIEQRATLASNSEYEKVVRYYLLSAPEEAIEVCNNWFIKAGQFNNQTAQVDALNSVSRVKITHGNYSEAESDCQKAIIICKEYDNREGLANQFGNLGVIAELTGNYPKAVQYYLSADSVYTITGNIKNRAYIENNLGIVYSNIKVFEKSLFYYLQALEHKKALNDSAGMASTYINIGVLYESVKHDYNKALNQYQKAKAILDKSGLTPAKASVYNNIGLILLHQNKLNDAREFFNTALLMQKSLQSKYGIASTILNLALLSQKEKDFKTSVAFANQSAEIYEQNNVKPKLAECYKLLAEGYESMGQSKPALDNFKKYVSIQDSILNEANLKTTRELEARYQNEVSQKKITILEQQNKINRLILIALLLGIAAVVISALLILRQRRLKQNMHQLTVEHRLLRTQLNPHFIFNSIGSVQNFMHRNDSKKASAYLANFAVLMRAILEQSKHDLITLAEEIRTLENYLLLEQMRNNNSFRYEIITGDNLEPEETDIPPMLIQPFVENAIKHAFNNESPHNKITIMFTRNKQLLNVQITDNGCGINSTMHQSKEHKSMATEIFVQRLHTFGKKWEKLAGFTIEDLSHSGNSGTRVCFNVPLTTE